MSPGSSNNKGVMDVPLGGTTTTTAMESMEIEEPEVNTH